MASLPSYLDELDALLLQLPDDCMLLSSLDGFLSGVLISPDMIPPSQWLKVVWGGEAGEGPSPFDEVEDIQRLLDLVEHHYNSVLRSLNHPGEFEPIFDIDTRTNETLWELWIEGFTQAMRLAPQGWQRIAASGDSACDAALAGIATLRAIANGERKPTLKEQEEWDRQVPDLIPIWIEVLHQWRLENDPIRPTPARRIKVGRNDPCPCGSGKKYKKCCGLN